MADNPSPPAPARLPSGTGAARLSGGRRHPDYLGYLFALRKDIPRWQAVGMGLLCLAVCFGLWWFVTRGEPGNRLISENDLPSPRETFAGFPALWYDLYLTLNTYVTLKRVVLGFGLAALVGVPLGVLCGCFPRVNAFFLPVTVFGRNIPIAALIPLTFGLFGIGEAQKVMFIFIACVAFVISDTARAIAEVGDPYIDTAYTLGASRRQVILKVLVPLAMPSVFNSLRLLFGLAFGYIMLAEVIKFGSAQGGLGDLIEISQRRGHPEYIILILLIIPVLALGIDRLLFWVQKELFPYRYGGEGILDQWLRLLLHGWEDFQGLFRRRAAPAPAVPPGDKSDGDKP